MVVGNGGDWWGMVLLVLLYVTWMDGRSVGRMEGGWVGLLASWLGGWAWSGRQGELGAGRVSGLGVSRHVL